MASTTDPAPYFHYMKNGSVNTLLTGTNGTMIVDYPFGLRNDTTGAIGTVINGVKKFFTLAAVSPELTLSETSGTVAYPNIVTFTVSRNGTGEISVDTSNADVATAQISDNTVTITTVKPGSATITVSVAESTGYLADQTTYAVTVTKGVTPILRTYPSKSIDWNGTTSFQVSAVSRGALSVTPTNNTNSYINATVSGNVITVSGRAYTTTPQTVTVTIAATDYYESNTTVCTIDSVNRTSPGLTISKTSGTLAYPATDSFTWSRSGSGKVTAVSNQTGIATTTNPNSTGASGTITVSSVKPSGTQATITVSVEANGNYLSETKTYTATVNKGTNTLTLTRTSTSVAWNGTTTFKVNKNTSGGTLSVSPTNNSNSYINATISETTVTLTGRAYTATAQTITVTSAATDYYNSQTATCEVTIDKADDIITIKRSNGTTLISGNGDSLQYGETATYTITHNSTGTLSVSPTTNNDYIECSISENILTVKEKKAKNENGTQSVCITVTSAAIGGYNAGSFEIWIATELADPQCHISGSQYREFTWPQNTDTFTIKKLGSGKFTVTSTDPDVLTVSPSSTTATSTTFTVTFKKPGNANLDLCLEESPGYYTGDTGNLVYDIIKGQPEITLEEEPDKWLQQGQEKYPMYEVDATGTRTFKIAYNGNGALSVGELYNSETASVSINTSTKVVTITGKKYNSSNHFMIRAAENDYYYEAYLYVQFNVNKLPNTLTTNYQPASSGQVYELECFSTMTVNVTNPSGGKISVDGQLYNTGKANFSINQNTSKITVTGKYISSGQSMIIRTDATDVYDEGIYEIRIDTTGAAPPITLSKESSTISYPNSDTFTIRTSSEGQITISNTNATIASGEFREVGSQYKSATVGVKSVKPNASAANIVVNVAGDSQYRSGTKIFTVTVNKGTNTLTLSKTSASIAWNSSDTFTVSTNTSGGALSVTPTNNSNGFVNATISGSTVTVTGRAYTATAQTITVTSAATDYYESKTATYSCTLSRTAGSVALSATSGNVDWNGKTTFTVNTNLSGGALTVSSNATDYATASINTSTKVVTITGKAYRSSAVTITVNSAANGNYNAASATFTVYVKQTPATFNLSKDTVDVNWNSTTTVSVTNIVGGAISVSSNATSYATVAYDSSTKVITITGKAYRSSAVTISVTAAASGNYSATTKSITVNVKQTSPGLTLSATSGTLTYPTAGTFTWSKTGAGKVTATSGATGTATTSNPNSTGTSGTITVTPVKPNTTAAVITVSVAASGNYYSETKTYNATVNKGTNTLTLSATSGTVTYGTPTTFSVTTNTSGGALSVASANANYVSAEINTSTKVVTLNVVNYNSTKRNITVTSAATDYYNSQTAVYSATSAKATPSITISPTASTVVVGQTQTITVTSNISGGTVTAKTANSTYATVSKTDNTTFVVTAKKYQEASTNITFDIATTTNYVAATTAATYTLTPARIATSLTFDRESIEVLANSTATFNVTRSAGSGTLTVSSANENIATATISKTTVTVTYIASGTTTITVNCDANNDYDSCTKQISITCMKSMDSYTWGEINVMTMNGTLLNYCTIGDYKIVTVNAQIPAPEGSSLGTTYAQGQMRAVFVGFDHNASYEGETCYIDSAYSGSDKKVEAHNATFALIQDYNGKPCAFIAPQGNALLYSSTQTALVGSTNTGTTLGPASWRDNQLRTRVMENFRLVNGPTLAEVVKPTSLAKSTTDDAVRFDINYDQANPFFLPSDYEILGSSNANSHEKNYLKQYEYFTSATQRTLYGLSMTTTSGSTTTKLTASTTAVPWFTRSFASNTAKPVIINASGAKANGNANTSYGIVPFFTIGDSVVPGRMSWRAIKDINKYQPDFWTDAYEVVGTYKLIHLEGTVGTLELNGDYVARCIGRDHNSAIEGTGRTDWVIDRNSTGNVCIAFADSKYNTSTTDTNYFAHINGNWFESNIRTNILPQFLDTMPDDLKACIAYTKKYAAQNGNGFQPYRSKIWTFSAKEGGGTSNATDSYNVAYGQNLITTHYKHNAPATTCMYWVRPTTTTANYMCRYSGTSANNGTSYNSYSYGIIPCFSIGDDSDYCSLNDYTWDQLNAYAKSGDFPSMFALGDYKTVKLNGKIGNSTISNKDYRAMYVGSNNDDDKKPIFMIDGTTATNRNGVYSGTDVALSYQLP